MTAPATGMSIARGQWSFLPGLVAEAVLVARPDARDARPPDRPCRAGHEDRRRIAAGRAADIHCEERAGRTGRRTLDLDDRAADLPLRLVGYRKDHFAAALLRGLAYALLAENVHPLIPLVTAETFAVWVVAAVALAELLKNVFYEPSFPGGPSSFIGSWWRSGWWEAPSYLARPGCCWRFLRS